MKILFGLPFKEWLADLEVHHYPNNRLALILVGKPDGYDEVLATASVNMVEEDCPEGEVWIKDYAENEGMTKWLTTNCVIEASPRDNAQTGFEQVHRYKLSRAFLEAMGEALVREGERSGR